MHFLQSWKWSPLIEACAVANVVPEFSSFCWLYQPPWISLFIGVYAAYSLQNRFGSFVSLFGLSSILKIRTFEHAHYLRLAARSAWNRQKKSVGKEFDLNFFLLEKIWKVNAWLSFLFYFFSYFCSRINELYECSLYFAPSPLHQGTLRMVRLRGYIAITLGTWVEKGVGVC